MSVNRSVVPALSSEVFDLKPTSPPARSSYDGAIIGIQTL